jgi:hypothetical protein
LGRGGDAWLLWLADITEVAFINSKFITDGVLSRTLAADAGEENENVGLRRGRLARRDFPKRCGFFFQCEANDDRGFIIHLLEITI